MQKPQTPEELAEALGCAASRRTEVRLGGNFSKDAMAGPLAPAELTISTAALSRVLQFEPHDLTISVEAGLPWAELTRLLEDNRMMLPLDPPCAARGTVGGVIAANLSGPRRRLYGTARDAVIGMRFATLEGKLVQSGGMVVKNVAGLDMAKLMVGSFGTLAAIASVNFRLFPMPVQTRSFLVSAGTAAEAVAARNRVLNSVLQPAALDVLNHHAAGRVGLSGYVLAVRAAGSPAVIERYARELPEAAVLDGSDESAFWGRIQEFTPEFLADHSEGAVVRISSTLSQLEPALAWDSPVVARGGSGVAYIHFAHWRDAAEANAAVEWAPPAAKDQLTLWPNPGGDLDIMKRIKGLFDPGNLLNRGRLYGRI